MGEEFRVFATEASRFPLGNVAWTSLGSFSIELLRPATEAVGTSKGYLQMAGKPIGRLPGKVVGASLEENNF